MQYAKINGAELAYDVVGQGPPLIFVHGFLASGTGPYYTAFKRLLAAFYHVYFIDMRAHGGSSAIVDNATLDQSARDVAAFADLFQLEDVSLVGHSMGGFISMAAAIQHPRRFKALGLVTPAASKGAPAVEEQVADFMAARKSPEMMDQRFAGMFVRPPAKAELASLRDAALRLPDAVAERWMREEWPSSDLTDGLGSIDVPILSIIAAQDVVVPPERQYEDALRLPKAKVVTFTDEGHMFPLEQPDRCASEVLRFFRDLA